MVVVVSTRIFLVLALVLCTSVPTGRAGVVVEEIAPACGPSGGRTVVSVRGSGFSGAMRCIFDEVSVPATVESEEALSCTTEPSHPGRVSFSLESAGGEVIRTNHSYEYYTDPTISGYKPKKAPLNKEVRVHVHGSFEVTKNYTCMFSGSSSSGGGGQGGTSDRSVVTVGTLSDDKGTITCYTPKWDAHEEVALSVSLNGQQYSIPVAFMFKNEGVKVSNTVLIVLGGVLLVVVVVAALAAVWVRHRHYIAGYNKIKEGNAEVDISEIKYGSVIGRGTFGEVYKGTWRGAVVAVKKLNSAQMGEEFVKEYEREVYLMRTLRAPNILQFLGSTFNPPDICIIMEYMSRGSLYNILHDETCALEWPRILHMLADTAKGMTYLHTCKPPVIHRDLKSHNLLVDEFWRVKVSDFGLSTVFEQTDQTMAAYGTPCWTAPEVLRSLHYTVKADVYSFAIVMWECVTREDPYENMLPYKVIYAVGNKGLRPQVPPWVQQQYANLMRSCWDDDMDMRPEFPAILDEIEEMAQLKWAGPPNPESTLRADNGDTSSANTSTNTSTASSTRTSIDMARDLQLEVKVSVGNSNSNNNNNYYGAVDNNTINSNNVSNIARSPTPQQERKEDEPAKRDVKVPATPLFTRIRRSLSPQIPQNRTSNERYSNDGKKAGERLPLLNGQYGDSYTVAINGTEISDSDDDSSERSTSFHSSDEDSDDYY